MTNARHLRCLMGTAAAAILTGGSAAADVPFVERHVTLAPLHMSADVGVGVAQWEDIEPDPVNPQGVVDRGNKVGFGTSLEAAVGLPYLGELAARVGYRFDAVGANAQADHFGRLFDPVVNEPGVDSFTNPEIILRGTMFALPLVEVALEMRAVIPTASNSDFALTPGAPVRIHIPTFARIDTGIYVPVAFNQPAAFELQVPAQLFFQAGDAFFGPLTGLLYVQNGGDPNPQILAGVGGGYTLGILDLKTQVYTTQVNDVTWTKHIGAGLGVGVRL